MISALMKFLDDIIEKEPELLECFALAGIISEEHPEILKYYELSNHTKDLDIVALVRGYEIDDRYKVEFRKAAKAAYLSIRRSTNKKETIDRLDKEYDAIISKLA